MPLLRPQASHVPFGTLSSRRVAPVCLSFTSSRKVSTSELDARKGNRERVVILGSGWAGFVLSRQLSASKYQTVVVSPRSYFVFTPLLAGSAVGSQEFRTILEPVRNRKYPNVEFMQAWADNVDFSRRTVTLEESVTDPKQSIAPTADRYEDYSPGEEVAVKREKQRQGKVFDLTYDKLVVAVGSYSQTFGTPGVRENAYFLKDVSDARRIRKRVLECFELAALPTTDDAMKRRLLHFAVIGGGPTGMEFAAELSDLVHEDMAKLYPGVAKFVKVTVFDVAPKVLSMFDEKLASYAYKIFAKHNIDIKTRHHVEWLRKGLSETGGKLGSTAASESCYTIKVKELGEIEVGACIWSTGNMANPFVHKALEKVHRYPENSIAEYKGSENLQNKTEWVVDRIEKSGVIKVDDYMRVKLRTRLPESKSSDDHAKPEATAVVSDVFALGDTAVMSTPLPGTAQVANQQALWLGKRLNSNDFTVKTFHYKNLGVMANIGGSRALLQTGNNGHVSGRTAWWIWKGAYVSMAISWRNKMLIPFYWFLNWAFGRDITRF